VSTPLVGDTPDGAGNPSPPEPSIRRPWHARRWAVVGLAVLVVVAVSVLLDLPHHASGAEEVREASAVVTAVDAGIASCTYSVTQAFSLLDREHAGRITAAERPKLPGMISDDAKACSSSNATAAPLGTTVFGTLTLSSTPAGRDLTTMVKAVLDWTTFDAPGALDDIQILVANPENQKATNGLATQEKDFAKDRAAADRAIRLANLALRSSAVADPRLPSLPVP
jgi:hypothetical protein